MTEVIKTIAILCSFSNLEIKDETKLKCIDSYTNCMITSNKKPTIDDVKRCERTLSGTHN